MTLYLLIGTAIATTGALATRRTLREARPAIVLAAMLVCVVAWPIAIYTAIRDGDL